MKPAQSLEQVWRTDVFRNFATWDRVADAFNPLMALLLLGAALWLSRESQARAWRFLGRSVLALVITFLMVKVLKRFDWFEPGDFPSTHMAVAASLLVSLVSLSRGWLLLLPLVAAYAWMMTALRFHTWIDIVGGASVAIAITTVVQTALSHRRRAERTQTSTHSSSNARRRSSADGNGKADKTPRRSSKSKSR